MGQACVDGGCVFKFQEHGNEKAVIAIYIPFSPSAFHLLTLKIHMTLRNKVVWMENMLLYVVEEKYCMNKMNYV